MIYDLVDIILLKHPHLKRETVQEILTTTTNVIVENVKDNKCVKWAGLCTFTWKKKAKPKKKPLIGLRELNNIQRKILLLMFKQSNQLTI
jgi:nucleoid DNA-binding protein